MLQHGEVEKQGRSRLHERKHRIFTLYLLDFVICHVFIGRFVSLPAHNTGVPGQARVWWPTGGGCGCWSTLCVWAPCTGQPTFCGRGWGWPSPPPSTRGIIRCRHSRGYLYTRVLQCARVAASCGAGTACHTLARHVYSLVWAWADITLWKGGAASRVTCHVSPVTCAGLWDGYDHYAGWGVAQSGATLGAGLLLLSATRTVRSAFGAPVPSLDII